MTLWLCIVSTSKPRRLSQSFSVTPTGLNSTWNYLRILRGIVYFPSSTYRFHHPPRTFPRTHHWAPRPLPICPRHPYDWISS